MGAILATLATLAVMAAALVVLARGWPRSWRGVGYRLRDRGRTPDAADEAPPVPEDDDVRWRWRR